MRIVTALVAGALATTAAARPALAQTSAPTPTAGTPDPTGLAYRYAAGVDGNLALGVVDRFLVNARGDALITTPIWGVYIEPRWTYAEVNDSKTDAEYYFRAVGFFHPRDRFYGFAVGLLERSFRRRYEVRATGGGGVGVNVLMSGPVQLLAAEGLVVETTEFYVADLVGDPDATSTRRNVVRPVTRLSGRIRLAEKTALFFDAYLKPAIDDVEDYRILAKASFDLAIAYAGGHQIVARALLDYTRETVRVVGTSEDELMLTFGVGVRRD
jgi:hypothetical protein